MSNNRLGTKVVFTVAAYPDHRFAGLVGSVSETRGMTEYDSTHDVVIDAPNPGLLLEPGMSVTARIEVDRAAISLRAPD